jgi:hypothetical protein
MMVTYWSIIRKGVSRFFMSGDLQEALAAARHDLGKYVAMNVRWLPEDASAEDLRSALVADLCRTKESEGKVESAVELWQRLRRDLVGLELGEVDRLVGVIEEAIPQLGKMDRGELERVAEAAKGVGGALRRVAARG